MFLVDLDASCESSCEIASSTCYSLPASLCYAVCFLPDATSGMACLVDVFDLVTSSLALGLFRRSEKSKFELRVSDRLATTLILVGLATNSLVLEIDLIRGSCESL